MSHKDFIKEYPLSEGQKLIFIHYQVNSDHSTYNESVAWYIHAKLDVENLCRAFIEFMKRHEVFRSIFVLEEEPVQKVYREPIVDFEYLDMEGADDVLLRNYFSSEARRRFVLEEGVACRIRVLRISDEKYILLFVCHHMIIDGWTLSLMLDEVGLFYQHFCEGSELHLDPVMTQYSDFVTWQKNVVLGEQREAATRFWKMKLSNELPVLSLPTYPNPHSTPPEQGSEFSFSLQEDTTQQLRDFCQKVHTTVNTVMFSLYSVLLYRLTGQEHIVIGTPRFGRKKKDFRMTAGYFVNMLPIQIQFSAGDSFRDLLHRVRDEMDQSLEYQDFPFSKMVEECVSTQDNSHHPIFQTVFVLQKAWKQNGAITLGNATNLFDVHGLLFEPIKIEKQNPKFILSLHAEEEEERICCHFEYNRDVLDEHTVKRFTTYFDQLVRSFLDHPDGLISEACFVPESEQRQLLEDWNCTQTEYPRESTIHELFEKQVKCTPENVAVVYKEQQLTYRELDQKANQLAHYLQKKGMGSESLIGLCVEPSLEMIVSVLGILKAGGAYVPLDPTHPESRLLYMVEDAGVQVLVTKEELRGWVPEELDVVCLDRDQGMISIESTIAPVSGVTSENVAYVIYTSGSTGKPKGVLVEHRSLVNLSCWHNREYDVTEVDRTAKFASFGFDASVWEIFPYLISGAAIYMLPDEMRLDLNQLNQYFEQNRITISFLPTQLCEHFMEWKNQSLRILLTGGDKLTKHIPQDYKVINSYGPTENTVVTTAYTVNEQMVNIPIGKPIDNVSVYVLDSRQQIQPIGVAGELCIAGDGLARGYLNNPELTAKTFIDHPFVPGERMYRTGDLVRWLPNGEIEYLGRTDNQVKIRGYRIELGEIASQLLSHPAIKEAVVITRSDSNKQPYLCAYVVGNQNWEDLKLYLSQSLPGYMIPSAFVAMEEIPLTVNGKIDVQSLPEPDQTSQSHIYVAPTNETEARLAGIWQEVLGVVQIGIEDNFFDLGGHSLKAMRLVSQIQREFGVAFPLQEVFRTTMLKDMAKQIQVTAPSMYTSIPAVECRQYYPVSSAQRRMYLVQQMDPDSVSYNMPMMMRVKGSLDVGRLEEALCQLIKRHESLRTSFKMIEGKPHQVIAAEVPFSMIRIDSSESEAKQVVEEFLRPFDLSQAPLLRASWVTLSADEALFLLDMNHIISDGISMSILFHDLMELYKGEELPEHRIQYKDYAMWQQGLQETDWSLKQEKYWLEALEGELPVLNLPTDYSRPLVRGFEGSVVEIQLSEEATDKLKQLARKQDSTLYMALLAIYTTLLHKYSAQEDIIVGSPIAGRPHADVENMVGMFVNTLAMRNYPSSEKTFAQFMGEVKANALESYKHQDYPFEELVEKIDVPRDLSRNPLFDTMFSMQDIDIPEIVLDDSRLSPYEQEYRIAKFDLTLDAVEEGERLCFRLEYDVNLFKHETIERMASHLVELVSQVCQDPTSKIGELHMLPKQEEAILQSFNDTMVPYDKEKTIVEIFEEKVKQYPDRVAVVYEDEELTFQELSRRADQLAYGLRSRGVGREKIVGLMVDRSLEMMIGVFGILKAGGAYLPIDPSYPEDRIEYMLDDCDVELLLVQQGIKKPTTYRGEIVFVDEATIYNGESRTLEPINQANDLAYIIYTSGSTGKPKGIMIEHQAVMNLVLNARAYGIKAGERVLQLASISFDSSVGDIFYTLLTGASLFIPSRETMLSGLGLVDWLKRKEITIIHFVPVSFLKQLPYVELPRLHTISTGGEVLTSDVVQTWGENRTFLNAYGPSETTVDASVGACKPGEMKPSIGKPIVNKQIYILNKDQKLQPIGIPGEIYIGGEGIARGYWKRPDLTEERFLDNPFLPGTKMYRTGDRARWLVDGTIEFMERIDDQVKIRGYRIELGEITNGLLTHPAVKDATVIARNDKDVSYLCGYVVLEEEHLIYELRDYLKTMIPDYMVPPYFVKMDQLPTTANGKIDYRALPAPDLSMDSHVNYIAPSNEIEEKLATIWQTVLGLEQVGVKDNFFDLGGHSLSMIKVLGGVYEYGWDLSIKDFYALKTIEEMARKVAGDLEVPSEMEPSFSEITTDRRVSLSEIELSGDKRVMRNILLLGATGFLGAHILHELLVTTSATLYCVVRGVDGQEAEKRFRDKIRFYFPDLLSAEQQGILDRVHILKGDLTSEKFGLRSNEYENLCQTVDTVVNTAALVKHFGEYEEFRLTNVQSVEHAVSFCLEHDISFHQVSTVSVSGLIVEGSKKPPIFTESDFYIGQDYRDNVYVRSKFEAEKVIFDAMEKGLSASIYRVGNLTGRMTDGVFQENIHENMFYLTLKSFMDMKMIIPQMVGQSIEFTPVDICARAIVNIARTKEAANRVFHIFHHRQVPCEKLCNAFHHLGIDVQIPSTEEAEELVREILKSERSEALAGLVAYGQHANTDPNTWVQVDSSLTRHYLKQIHFVYPTLDETYLEKVIEHMMKVNFAKTYSLKFV
ncbi:non-ribosomal peptide synthetase [Thermoactinomyces sp. DSM 45892]|uniref:non-ribosomal peptide synthetase n=1 Tax=Thermoactinomyces sp. DSM 45892 TaxID=1882753 RepID=UPI00089534B9|nr:non-ribosomal peptide synthetase [Thermoactinomyces sp. DSM 45892]SDY59268.1 fengycin family lipopeptide synthetase D [Thermoactinomyces sp. DSM 45892]